MCFVCCLCMRLLVSHSNHLGKWVFLSVNQWSGIDYHHPRVPMPIGSASALKACKDKVKIASGSPKDTDHSSNSENVKSVEYSVWCALTWNFNSHLYIPVDMSLFCQLWSCRVLISNDKETHCTASSVCLELPLSLPKPVNTGHIHLNTKSVACVLWGVPLQ